MLKWQNRCKAADKYKTRSEYIVYVGIKQILNVWWWWWTKWCTDNLIETFHNMLIPNQLCCQTFWSPLFSRNTCWGVNRSKCLWYWHLLPSHSNFVGSTFCWNVGSTTTFDHIIIILSTKLLSIISWTSFQHNGAFSILREITSGNLFRKRYIFLYHTKRKVRYHNGVG